MRLSGDDPFDEATTLDDEPDEHQADPAEPSPSLSKPAAGTQA